MTGLSCIFNTNIFTLNKEFYGSPKLVSKVMSGSHVSAIGTRPSHFAVCNEVAAAVSGASLFYFGLVGRGLRSMAGDRSHP